MIVLVNGCHSTNQKQPVVQNLQSSTNLQIERGGDGDGFRYVAWIDNRRDQVIVTLYRPYGMRWEYEGQILDDDVDVWLMNTQLYREDFCLQPNLWQHKDYGQWLKATSITGKISIIHDRYLSEYHILLRGDSPEGSIIRQQKWGF
ncbi:hypothetical protein JD969_16915 [Planctomycetota bacterium]|nr:hypothetical protein JD969_16915 [Planctomycetota bacterium]